VLLLGDGMPLLLGKGNTRLLVVVLEGMAVAVRHLR
jgi:hypothetical protein